MVTEESVGTEYNYRLVCLDLSIVLRREFKNIEDIIGYFKDDGYEIINLEWMVCLEVDTPLFLS